MKRTLILAGAACLSLTATAAFAQTETVVVEQKPSGGAAAGVVAGAATGAVVAGPVGAVVGGVAGAVAGSIVAPPVEVRTYVTGATVAPVTYQGDLVVGSTFNGDVTWYEVPRYTKYRWAYLNGKRVVVEYPSRRIVGVY